MAKVGSTSGVRVGSNRFIATALALATAVAPTLAFARPPSGRLARNETSREARRAGPVVVALGTSANDAHARDLLDQALADAVRAHPVLQLQPHGVLGASLVVRAFVRSLTVQHDALGDLARCDVSVVISDGTGAVRAMLDTRRTVRGNGAAEVERTAVRGAAEGLVRDLVAQMIR